MLNVVDMVSRLSKEALLSLKEAVGCDVVVLSVMFFSLKKNLNSTQNSWFLLKKVVCLFLQQMNLDIYLKSIS